MDTEELISEDSNPSPDNFKYGDKEMTQNLKRLIATDEPENIELAFQLLKGINSPVLRHIPRQVHLDSKRVLLRLAYNFPVDYLYDLFLSHARIDKLTPSIANIRSLSNLWLDHNYLETLPELPLTGSHNTSYSYLHLVSLAYNKFKEFPDKLFKHSNLKRIYLQHNHISVLPGKIGNLTNLQYLNLSHNQINSLPEEIFKLHQLVQLRLDKNLLHKIPDSLNEFTNLQYLTLSRNQLSEIDFKNFSQNSALRKIELQFNNLSEFPLETGLLPHLHTLNINYNHIKTVLMEGFPALQNLFLTGNGIEDLYILPDSLPKIRKIHLHHNQLTGIPETFGELITLRELRLYNNLLQSIPENIGNLENLRYLSLEKNRLKTLPESISKLKKLEELYLADNLFSETEQQRIRALVPHSAIYF
jgi:Leucine-rich repeat (LRR) protein